MSLSRSRSLADRLGLMLRPDADLPELAETVYDALRQHVSFDFACLATTDPASGVVTWTSKTRSLGIGDEEFAAAEYGGPDINKFEEIVTRRPPVGVLSIDTGGNPDAARRHREYMHPRFGFTDELRAACLSRSAVWGALALYRGEGDPPFDRHDAEEVASICGPVAEAIQRSLFRLGATGGGSPVELAGPAVMIVGADDRVTHLTPAARPVIELLGGYDHGALPANVLAVMASARTRERNVESRAQASDGSWFTLRAVPLDGGAEGHRDVVVTLEPTTRATLSRMALAAHGLTSREEDVAVLVLQGVSTQDIAATLHLSPHTVQDHLKAVFAKLGVTSRREMTARLILA